MGGRIQWSLEELSASLCERAPEVEAARVDLALGLLRLPLDRQRWYSECYPVAEADEAAAALAEWRSLAPVIEPLLISERPAYEYSWHPLPALIIASQFLWHWWELREAAPLLERAIDLAEAAKTPDGLIIQGRERIAGEVAGDRWGDHPYSDPRFYPIGWYFLGEIAEAEGRPADALAWYERFIAAEPDFAPLADFELDEWFFYGKRYPPNTVEACRRAGRCAEAIGDEGRARRLYAFGLSLRRSRFSPLRERAALRRREGDEAAALADELAYLDGLLAGYQASLRELGLFERYLELAARCAEVGESCLEEQAKRSAVEALRRTFTGREASIPEVPAGARFAPPEVAVTRLRALAVAAMEGTLFERCQAALFDAAVSRALGHRGDREALAEIEAEVERLRVARRWVALRGRCAEIEAILARLRAEAATPYRRDVPPLTDDLAALAALYGEAAAAEGSA
ncbi:MAG: hypothetical protein KC486_17115 [Myxococcales bacterium]|nr:hypothetical protein [Myxococcales bacterium]